MKSFWEKLKRNQVEKSTKKGKIDRFSQWSLHITVCGIRGKTVKGTKIKTQVTSISVSTIQ